MTRILPDAGRTSTFATASGPRAYLLPPGEPLRSSRCPIHTRAPCHRVDLYIRHGVRSTCVPPATGETSTFDNAFERRAQHTLSSIVTHGPCSGARTLNAPLSSIVSHSFCVSLPPVDLYVRHCIRSERIPPATEGSSTFVMASGRHACLLPPGGPLHLTTRSTGTRSAP